ncbi:MAG TPA: PucR family transcriptional regulator ligand-binding domain-containing protein [Actinomycetes bacterium]|nr:PucR family transcriptional regulator ligand-binding domain-containing protein [Actinomycetes bacterium]
MPTLSAAQVLAGHTGLHRVVQRLNVMTVPDILPWVKENEFLLATGYPLPRSAAELAELVSALDACGLAALGVKLGNYIEALPRAMLQRADQLDFPIIDIPRHVGFDDILSQALTDIINRQSAVLARAEEIHRVFMRIVLDGGGLPEITEKLSQLIEGAVVVLADDGRVLAEARLAEVAELLATAGLLGEDGRIVVGDAIVPETRVQASGDVRWALAPVLAGSMRHGRILAVEGERPLRHDVLIALERASTVIALDAAKKLAVTAVERKFQSDFLHELLSGRVRNVREVLNRATSLGWCLDRPLVVIVAELERAPGDELSDLEEQRLRARLTDGWTYAVHDCDPGAAAAGFATELVAIVGAPDHRSVGAPDHRSSVGAPDHRVVGAPDHRDLAETAVSLSRSIAAGVARRSRRVLSVGVSRPVAAPVELATAYDQATKAMQIGRRIHGPGTVTRFDSLGVFRLLSLIDDTEELRSFAFESLGPLLLLAPAERDDLLRTLEALVECNLNVARAARRLYFHYNTLRYRITKLERLLGPFTTDPNRCLQIALALQILRIREVLQDMPHQLRAPDAGHADQELAGWAGTAGDGRTVAPLH